MAKAMAAVLDFNERMLLHLKPNLRFFSLSEDNQWTTWKGSDYFYPEMIPEPDYSDSGDDAGYEDEEHACYKPSTRSPLERLRDLTEVYVSNVDMENINQPRKTPNKQAGSGPKTASKQATPTNTTNKSQTPTAKRSPQALPNAPRKTQSKSPTKNRDTASNARRVKSPESANRSPTKTKSPTKVSGSGSATRTKSPEDHPSTSKSAAAARGDTLKPQTRGETSPKSPPKSKATDRGMTEPKVSPTTAKREAGDAPKARTERTPPSSPYAKSPVSTEHSSDEEEQLIKPKKPYQHSSESQKLHKELKFSQKYGKLISSKTELQLALERYTENKVKRELGAEEKTSLERILENQAKKIEMQEVRDEDPEWLERLQRPPATWPNPKTDEFFRVHARVVSSNILAQCFLPDDEQGEYSSAKTVLHSDSGSDS